MLSRNNNLVKVCQHRIGSKEKSQSQWDTNSLQAHSPVHESYRQVVFLHKKQVAVFIRLMTVFFGSWSPFVVGVCALSVQYQFGNINNEH